MSAVRPSHILGMNARTRLYTALNSKKAKKFGFSKVRAKSFLKKHGIPVPELYSLISSREELRNFDWHQIPGAFAVKPANGSAGKGIIVIKRFDRKKNAWIDVDNNDYTEDELRLHVSDILEGRYTTWGSHHSAIIEERIMVHPDLEPYVEMGTPDVRVIIFRKVPVMAMVRLPTEASNGRANLDQGALALGVDMGTGKSTYGLAGKKKVMYEIPKSGTSAQGIQIPYWKEILKTAVRVANATGYMFMGVDIFIDPTRGPMVAEVNGFPGLSVQLANRSGLRKRLERLEEIEARNVNHAIKISQSLFAESFPSTDTDLIILEPKEEVVIYGDQESKATASALINTGRFRSAIGFTLAQELGLVDPEDLLWRQAEEGEGKVPIVQVRFKIRDRVIETQMAVSKQLNRKADQVEIGRKDLKGFLVGEER